MGVKWAGHEARKQWLSYRGLNVRLFVYTSKFLLSFICVGEQIQDFVYARQGLCTKSDSSQTLTSGQLSPESAPRWMDLERRQEVENQYTDV